MERKMKAVIIEDEDKCREVIRQLLIGYCPDVEVVAEADSVSTGVEMLRSNDPDIVFLDVEINGGTGFDVLNQVRELDAAIVFTTAYDQFALKAFKFSAIDYLLKPIDIDELRAAVSRVSSRGGRAVSQYQIQNLLSNIRNPQEEPVLLVSTLDAVEFIPIRDIIRCEAQGAYTHLMLRDSKPVMVSKVIKEYEFMLRDHGFYRVHQSHLINLTEVRKYVKSDNYLLMRDGAQIQLARSRKEDFFNAMNQARA
jgi:two-component system LytT family response regulator